MANDGWLVVKCWWLWFMMVASPARALSSATRSFRTWSKCNCLPPTPPDLVVCWGWVATETRVNIGRVRVQGIHSWSQMNPILFKLHWIWWCAFCLEMIHCLNLDNASSGSIIDGAHLLLWQARLKSEDYVTYLQVSPGLQGSTRLSTWEATSKILAAPSPLTRSRSNACWWRQGSKTIPGRQLVNMTCVRGFPYILDGCLTCIFLWDDLLTPNCTLCWWTVKLPAFYPPWPGLYQQRCIDKHAIIYGPDQNELVYIYSLYILLIIGIYTCMYMYWFICSQAYMLTNVFAKRATFWQKLRHFYCCVPASLEMHSLGKFSQLLWPHQSCAAKRSRLILVLPTVRSLIHATCCPFQRMHFENCLTYLSTIDAGWQLPGLAMFFVDTSGHHIPSPNAGLQLTCSQIHDTL